MAIRTLLTYLPPAHDRVVGIDRKTSRRLPARRGVTFQRHQDREVPGPERDTQRHRIEHVWATFPDRFSAFDKCGLLGVRLHPGGSPF
ncbi:hypothetical protein F0344_00425 [Streptomyces finlayi]|uniref:Uncharacterized protein n=1 Tax=Streptomyces finlayi TaxID=67296 RepID=A0A7G7BD77_9ACTN|nr:hypothetical protein [Streptomyces finlayi]QNE73292.1 hypothetical protein F0344_00425 [Streptomyces finlayi]